MPLLRGRVTSMSPAWRDHSSPSATPPLFLLTCCLPGTEDSDTVCCRLPSCHRRTIVPTGPYTLGEQGPLSCPRAAPGPREAVLKWGPFYWRGFQIRRPRRKFRSSSDFGSRAGGETVIPIPDREFSHASCWCFENRRSRIDILGRVSQLP